MNICFCFVEKRTREIRNHGEKVLDILGTEEKERNESAQRLKDPNGKKKNVEK